MPCTASSAPVDDGIEDSPSDPWAMVAFVTLVDTHTPCCYLQFRDHNLLTEQIFWLWMLAPRAGSIRPTMSEHRGSPSYLLQMMKMQEKVPTGALSPPFRPSPRPQASGEHAGDPGQCADQPPLR